ncbi:MAG: nucleotidyltransferase domain-containing protein [bacterium]
MNLSKVVADVPQQSLDRVRSRIKGLEDRKYKIADIKVFGSRTKGNYKLDSDVDMVMIVSDSSMKDVARVRNIIDEIKSDFKVETGFKLDLNLHSADEIGPVTLFEWDDLKDF